MFGVIHDSEMQMQDDGVYSCCKKAVSCSYGCRKRKDAITSCICPGEPAQAFAK